MQITSEAEFLGADFIRKDGPAKYWYESGNMKSEGAYKNDLQLGEWKYYHRKTRHLSSQGEFENGKKIGLWKKYDSKGRLMEELHYISGKRVGSFIQYDSLDTAVNQGEYVADTLSSQSKRIDMHVNRGTKKVEEMPYLSSCKKEVDIKKRSGCSGNTLLRHIYSNLKYPAKARDIGMEGRVLAQFLVNKDGSVSHVDVYQALCQPFKDEVERLLLTLPLWEPGTNNGNAIDVYYTVPIRFRLE